jgi:hypothetical protein
MEPRISAPLARDKRAASLSRRSFVKQAAATLLIGSIGSLGGGMAYAASPVGDVAGRKPLAGAMPAWFARDVQRRARWLPAAVKELGLEEAYRKRWSSFSDDARAILEEMTIPSWMVALVPMAPSQQDEITKQILYIADLAGPAPASKLARRAEQLLIFGGAAQLPTPGDRMSGACLGAEGCTAAMSKYILAQLKIEFPGELARMSDHLADCQSSAELKNLCEQAARAGVLQVERRAFAQLRPEDVRPGSLTIAQKPGGTHVFGWTRVPGGWNWSPGDKMAIGNTGLAQYGDRMILAQEYVSADALENIATPHNEHGPINSRSVIYVRGEPDLSNPRTNVYAARGSDFVLVNLT